MRKPSQRIERLTAAQESRLIEFRARAFADGASCDPANRQLAERAVADLYKEGGYTRPTFIWCDSPATAALRIALPRRSGPRLGDSLGDSLWASLRDSLRDSLQDSLGAGLRDSLGASLRVGLGASLWDSLGASLGASLRDSLRASLRDSLGDSLGDSLWASLRDSLWAGLRDSLGAGLRDSLAASLQDSLWGSLGDSLRDSLGASLWDSLRDSLRANLGASLGYGGADMSWIAFYEFGAEIGATYGPASSRRLRAWSAVARSAGWWFPFERVCLICERPELLRWNSTVRPRIHCADGPAMRLRDGWAIYAWHGMRVPADLITSEVSAERIRQEPNAEYRRVLIQRVGMSAYLAMSDARLISSDPALGDLYEIPDADQPIRVLAVHNATPEPDGSRRPYVLAVPPRCKTPEQAHLALAGMPFDGTFSFNPIAEA